MIYGRNKLPNRPFPRKLSNFGTFLTLQFSEFPEFLSAVID